MNATNKCGHVWTGEIEKEAGTTWYMYEDENGMPYQSREVPAYRVVMDNACLVSVGNKTAIAPINPK